jgi:peroxiredoxin family protein
MGQGDEPRPVRHRRLSAVEDRVQNPFVAPRLPLLPKKLDLQVSPLGNPAMKMPMAGLHVGMPNLVGVMPGVTAAATVMMKNLIAKKGVASIEELRALAVESDVRMIACQMTMELFEFKLEDMIEGVTLGGAATYIAGALESDINLYM